MIDEEEEEVFQADTYADYMPSKCIIENRELISQFLNALHLYSETW